MKQNTKVTKYIGWFIVSFFVYFQFLIQTSASVMQDSWAAYFHLTPLGVSYLSASFFYTYLFFQIPIGVIYDRYSAKIVLAIATSGLGLGCVMFANSSQFEYAVLARMIMGACAAFGFIGMLKVTANNFPGKQFSLMMGISEAFAAISTMIGVVLLGWAMTQMNWQQLTIYFAAGVFLITLLVLIFIGTDSTIEKHDFSILQLFKNVLSAITNPVVLIAGIYGFFMASVVNSFTSLWGVSFLTSTYPINSTLAVKIMSTVFLGLAIGCPINGYFSKKYGNERLAMQVCSLICAMCMAAVIYLNVSVYILYFLFFMIGLMCAVYVQAFAIVGQAVPGKIQATSMSITNMLIMSGAPLLQIIIGALLDTNAFGVAQTSHQNFQIALSILPIGMVIAFLLCFLIKVAPADSDVSSSELVNNENK